TSVRKFVDMYGVVENVSDKEFFTNSSHVPVYYDISINDKIRIEAPYHEYENAGHILYVEIDGEAAKNIEALDDIVRQMDHHNVGYGSINHPVDRCPKCEYSGIIDDNCPNCKSDEIVRIRRITGYLVGDMTKWNTAKKSEEENRVKHGKN
ncbi:MAG: anaerobic ribonucleoside-triphosphate reductase, partial [Mycoplasmatales bacterium]